MKYKEAPNFDAYKKQTARLCREEHVYDDDDDDDEKESLITDSIRLPNLPDDVRKAADICCSEQDARELALPPERGNESKLPLGPFLYQGQWFF